jgi:cell division transport system permease protein
VAVGREHRAVKFSLLGFVLRRVRDNLRQLFWAHVLTAGIMALTLFVLGAFMLVEINLEKMLKGWGEQIQITAYLSGDAAADDVAALLQRVRTMAEVEQARHISREQAWRDFQAALGAQSGLLDGLPREALPASIEISLKPADRDAPTVEALAERLRRESEIASVEYPLEWVERLGLVVLAVGWIKWFLAGALFLATFFIVGSTVKLAAVARKDEVEIMQLVGASEELIQAPFVIEGMLQGLVGAALALAGLAAAFFFVQREAAPAGGLLAPLGEPQFLDLRGVLLLSAIGLFLGAAGSVVALRRFIKTWRAARA